MSYLRVQSRSRMENMSQLREHANAFPIEDIGVAQGNSLSPLLGNLFLYDFDSELNKKPDVRCIRYIDDFIVLAPTKNAPENAFAKAQHILAKLGLSVSRDNATGCGNGNNQVSRHQPSNGFIRPSRKAQERVLASIDSTLTESRMAFRDTRERESFQGIDRCLSLYEKWAASCRAGANTTDSAMTQSVSSASINKSKH